MFLTGSVDPEDVWAEPSVENRGPAQTAIKKPLDSIQDDEPVPVFQQTVKTGDWLRPKSKIH
ncbi:MAG: hypothetical protein DWI02_13240 [Planctomycetota bacterium]|nr:MAG: hypothetical protein DWI02_13240 [Planctomycetota bacterium]